MEKSPEYESEVGSMANRGSGKAQQSKRGVVGMG